MASHRHNGVCLRRPISDLKMFGELSPISCQRSRRLLLRDHRRSALAPRSFVGLFGAAPSVALVRGRLQLPSRPLGRRLDSRPTSEGQWQSTCRFDDSAGVCGFCEVTVVFVGNDTLVWLYARKTSAQVLSMVPAKCLALDLILSDK